MANLANAQDTFKAMISQPGLEPYSELSVLAAVLRAQAEVFQSHHWQSRGEPFYSDHKLYAKAYETASNQVDGVVERAVGLGSNALAAPIYLAEATSVMVAALYNGQRNVLSTSEMASVSLQAVNSVLDALAQTMQSLSNKGQLTTGLENLLQTYADEQESLGYFFRQRSSR